MRQTWRTLLILCVIVLFGGAGKGTRLCIEKGDWLVRRGGGRGRTGAGRISACREKGSINFQQAKRIDTENLKNDGHVAIYVKTAQNSPDRAGGGGGG